jgi:ribosome-binding factor A
MYNFKRSDRVSELLRHEISMMIQEIKDPRLGFVTITSVHLSDDLMDAKIYYSILGNDEERKISSEIIRNSVYEIRHRLGRKLESLRKVPVLTFILDDTPEKAQRVDLILKQLESEKSGEEPGSATLPTPEKKSPDVKKTKKS